MKTFMYTLFFLLLGIILGGLFVIQQVNQFGNKGDIVVRNGQWGFFPSMDLAKDDLQRAYIGKIGLLALRESEVTYFLLSTDDQGKALSAEYDYKLNGPNFDARYWSYTLYGGDHYLIPNDEKTYGINLENVVFQDSTNNSYNIYISKKPQLVNWIPSGQAKDMSILLRLYNPSEAIYKNRATMKLPTLQKIN